MLLPTFFTRIDFVGIEYYNENLGSVVYTTKDAMMKKYFKTINNSSLFLGISTDDYEKLLHCLSARLAGYAKGDVILMSGDAIYNVGLVLDGRVTIVKEDIDGNSTILTEMSASDIFGEVFVCADVPHSPVTILASEDTQILYVDYKKIISTCRSACPFHIKLIENMLKIIADKTLMLNQKIEILSKRSIRKKLICFFDYQRGTADKFTIPYNREEMANYLCIDRSALSFELCKMRDENLIKFNRNSFETLAKYPTKFERSS